MSDANRVKLAFVEESSFGAKESGSKLQVLRYNSESLKQDMNTVVSEEIRSDRQISDIARIGLSASGGIDFELSYGSHDEFLQAALLSSGWSAEKHINRQLTISASSVDNSINDSASGFGIFSANKWVYVSGFSNSANNGFFKIASVTASKIIFSNGTLVTEAAGQLVDVQQGGQITNGLVLPSFNIEKTFEDLSNVLSLLKGMCISTMSLEVPADGIIRGNFAFMGSAEESLTASAGSGYVAAGSTVVMTGANHVTNVFENLSELGILSFSFALNNNLRTRLQVGTLGVASIGSGSVEVTGTITLHLENDELFQKYLNQSVTSIVFAVRDEQGNGYLFEFPCVKITNGTRAAGGINTDVIGEFEFRAYMDASELITMRIARFPIMADMAGSIVETSNVTGSLTIT